MRSSFLASMLLLGGPVPAAPEDGERVPEGIIEIRSGGLRAVIADNETHGAVHRAGYSGAAEIEPAGLGRSVFVPAFAGLNFEHILRAMPQATAGTSSSRAARPWRSIDSRARAWSFARSAPRAGLSGRGSRTRSRAMTRSTSR